MILVVAYLRTDPSGILVYRRKFLKALRPFIPSGSPSGYGRMELKVSLRAKSLNVPIAGERLEGAKRQYAQIVAAAEKARAAAQKRAAGEYDDLDGPTIAALAALARAEELAADAARESRPEAKESAREAAEIMRDVGFEFPAVPEAAEWTLGIRAAHETIREAARTMRAIGDEDGIASYWGPIAVSLASEHGYELASGGSSHLALCEALNNAAVAASEDVCRRLDGDLVPTPPLPHVRRLEAVPASAGLRGETIKELLDAFKADREDKWTTTTRKGFIPVERVLRETLGDDLLLSDVTREHGRRLFEVVKKLPKGLGTLPSLRGVSVADAVQMGLPGLSPKSINATYLATMRAVFKFALQELWIGANPLLGLSVVNPVHDADKRDPSRLTNSTSFSLGAPWSPKDEGPRGKPIRYWGPMIALFLGMRRSEIAQLLVSDVAEVSGIPVILVKPGGGKRVKTRNSRRMLPVHPELIKLGSFATSSNGVPAGPGSCGRGEAQQHPTSGAMGSQIGFCACCSRVASQGHVWGSTLSGTTSRTLCERPAFTALPLAKN